MTEVKVKVCTHLIELKADAPRQSTWLQCTKQTAQDHSKDVCAP